MGTHLRVLNESLPMNTNMTVSLSIGQDLDDSQNLWSSCALDKRSLSSERVNPPHAETNLLQS